MSNRKGNLYGGPTVSSKGWVVIPAELRKKYDLEPGARVVIVDYGGELAIVPALSDPVRDLLVF